MSRLEILGLAWSLGLAGATSTAFALHLAGVSPNITLSIAAAIVVLSLVGGLTWRSKSASRPPIAALLCGLLAGLIVLRDAQQAAAVPLGGWDAWPV
jgi:hypothetical protein